MKVSHVTIILDEFLVVPNICPTSAVFLHNNLTYQICNTLTLWLCHIHKTGIDMDQHYEMFMDEFLLVTNICPNTVVFLHNNLTYQICNTC